MSSTFLGFPDFSEGGPICFRNLYGGSAKAVAEALYAALNRASSGLGPIGYQD
ncbi:hypothetical protein [Streptomyces sp. NPDC058394]|uniref:hypothetical protein n=1 Tax=Streptomyces sp. NPDC058394 TaxID=3346477 RepID=UPI00365D6A46